MDFKKTQLTRSEHGCWLSVEERVLRIPPAKEISLGACISIRLRKCNDVPGHNVMEKMEAKSLAELVSIAERMRIASSDSPANGGQA